VYRRRPRLPQARSALLIVPRLHNLHPIYFPCPGLPTPRLQTPDFRSGNTAPTQVPHSPGHTSHSTAPTCMQIPNASHPHRSYVVQAHSLHDPRHSPPDPIRSTLRHRTIKHLFAVARAPHTAPAHSTPFVNTQPTPGPSGFGYNCGAEEGRLAHTNTRTTITQYFNPGSATDHYGLGHKMGNPLPRFSKSFPTTTLKTTRYKNPAQNSHFSHFPQNFDRCSHPPYPLLGQPLSKCATGGSPTSAISDRPPDVLDQHRVVHPDPKGVRVGRVSDKKPGCVSETYYRVAVLRCGN